MSRERNPKPQSLPILDEDPRPWEFKVGIALIRFHSRLERRLVETIEGHGLTLPQFDVLATLWHGEGITQQELAERLLVTKGNVVGIIDRAGAAGWLERRPDPEDRRANRLYLTDAGRALLTRTAPCHQEYIKKVFGHLTQGELRLMHELLGRLEAASRDCGEA